MRSPAPLWLATVCTALRGARSAVLHLGTADRGPFPAVAHWPERSGASEALGNVALRALSERRAALLLPEGEEESDVRAGGADHAIALPLLRDGRLIGCVALTVEPRAKAEHGGTLRQLAAALPWLDALLEVEGRDASSDEFAALLASAIEPEQLRAAATGLATELAARLGCERVAVGLRHGGRARLLALSNNARFEPGSPLVRDLEAALDEALDQECVVAHASAADVPETGTAPVARAHAELAGRHGVAALLTVPFAARERAEGAFVFEWATSPATRDSARARRAALALGPLLALRREAERPLRSRARDVLHAARVRLTGPGHAVFKSSVAAGALALAVLTLLPMPHRVTARAALEGRVQRAVVAAIDGYVLEANARAGDVVRAGSPLAALDDRDLRLERRSFESEREQARKEYREALAGHDRTQAAILAARLAQAEAQLALVEERLARTLLVAPFDGVVVKGDLSQALGSPVAQGDVLFEIAPLADWRIMLDVDERDVGRVVPGQRGSLVLAARPGEPLPFTVERVTPVARVEEGHNVFRAEAHLESPPPDLRPGLEGVAKIAIGRSPLAVVYTERLFDALRLRLWTWLP